MPIQKTTYQCEICGFEHSIYDAALKCEAMGRPPMEFPIGTNISFYNEEGGMGGRYSYGYRTQPVIGSAIEYGEDAQGNACHFRVYFVSMPYMEALVRPSNQEHPWVSQAENKYTQGSVRKMLQEILVERPKGVDY